MSLCMYVSPTVLTRVFFAICSLISKYIWQKEITIIHIVLGILEDVRACKVLKIVS
jgi:hypothetical protein